MNFKGGYQSVDSYGGGGGGGGYGGGYGGGGGGGYGGGGGGYGGGGGGGGGYGGGGGGYGGGGFIQNSQGFSSPGMSPSVGGKGKPRNQSVIPLTSAQIMSAEEVTEGTFKTSGKEIGMVCVVGEIMEAQISPTHVVYQVDDRTGPWVKVQKWMSDQDSGDQAASCQEGMYVKAVGHLKVFNNQRSVTAFLIKPISDFNEVTHHLAEVMACHLMATKEMPVPEQFKKSVTGGGRGSWGTPMATSTQMTPMRGGGGMGGGYAGAQQTDDGLTSLQQQVLNTISSCQDQHGININQLIRNMSQRGQNEKNIKMAVEFLCNEGHIYSTIDDDHYKSING